MSDRVSFGLVVLWIGFLRILHIMYRSHCSSSFGVAGHGILFLKTELVELCIDFVHKCQLR